MPKRLDTVDHHDGNVVLISAEQLFVRFDIDLFESETIATAGCLDCEFGVVAEVTAGS
jgi:hypothetical protein